MAPTDRPPELDALPPRIARLVEQERGELLLPTDWSEVQARMWSGIGRGITPRWRRLVRSAVNAKSMSLLTAGIMVGIGGTLLLRKGTAGSAPGSSPAEISRPLASAEMVAVSPPPLATAASPVAPPARVATIAKAAFARHHPMEAVSDRPSMQVVAKAAAPPPPAPSIDLKSRYAEEQGLLERARDALRAGIPADAYAISQEHARRFPDGALAEERELIAIRALKALQQRRAMVERILEFHRRHPNSLLIPAVDALAPSISGE